MSYFDRMFEEMVAAGDDYAEKMYGDDETSNPDAAYEPAPENKCRQALRSVAAYLDKTQNSAVEEWNTHEQAEEALAFAVWSLACWALRQNKSDGWVIEVVAAETVGMPVMNDALQGILSGDSVWLDQFGDVG